MRINFFTTGVYGLSSDEFFNRLKEHKIDSFVDVRRRRAVRGSAFSFVNSKRLQDELKKLDIKYLHILDLAPTNEIRRAQKEDDEKHRVAKRSRSELGDVFKSLYVKEILSSYNIDSLIDELQALGAENSVIFCVEKEAIACHRSLIAERIQNKFNVSITHL